MRIAIVVKNLVPLPPVAYGGTERIVYYLARGLKRRGHHVTLVGAGGQGAIHIDVDRIIAFPTFDIDMEAFYHWAAANVPGDVEVVNEHTGGQKLCLLRPGLRVVSTLHLAMPYPHVPYPLFDCAAQAKAFATRPNPQYAHAGLDVNDYPFSAKKDDYLLFMGRMYHEKGAHLAVQVARATGVPLVIIGNHIHRPYFERWIAPYLGEKIRFVGEKGGQERAQILARARALLFPVQFVDPFGFVQLEALASGTPVIAMDMGSPRELVPPGVGFVCSSVEGMAAAVGRLHEIDPHACRRHVAENLSADRMAEAYEAVFRHYFGL